MRRNKLGPDKRAAIKQTYRLLYKAGLNTTQAVEQIKAEVAHFDEVDEICNFFLNSKRGVAQAFGAVNEGGREMGEILEGSEEF